jgi:acyl-CoA thioester hydrolase
VTANAGRTEPRITRVRVRYAETDRMGVVYYANYLVWFEVGRTEWLRETGWSYREMELDGISLPVIEAHAEYRRPARYDDHLEIRTAIVMVSPVRIRFDYEIWRQGEESPLAVGHTVHAALDVNGRPCRLPASIRDRLAAGEAAAASTTSTIED